MSTLIHGDLKCRMFIPKALGGKVVGTKGSTIINVMTETKARSISALKPMDGTTLWIPIAITGAPDKVVAAYNAISASVDGEVDGVIFDFQVQRKFYSNLYDTRTGKMHCRHVYEISAESNCRIQMPDQIISTMPLAVTLEGTLESAVKCMDLFLSKRPAATDSIGSLGSGISSSVAGAAGLGPKSSSSRGPPAQQSRPSTAAGGAAAAAGLGIRADDGSFLSLDQHSPFSFSSFGLGAGGSVPGGELTYGQHANANMLSMGLLGGGQGVPGVSGLAADHDLDGRDDGGLGLGRQQLGQSVGGLEYSLSFPLPSSGSGGSLHGMGGMMGGGDMGSNGLGSSAQLHLAQQQHQQQRQNQNGQAQAQQAQPPVVHVPRETFRERVRVTLAQLPRIDEQYTVNSVPAGSSSPPLSPGTPGATGGDSGSKLVQLIPFLLKLFAVANLRITPSLPQVRKALTQPQGQGQGGRGGAANVSGGNGKSAGAAAAAAAESEGANFGRRRRASDNDDEDDDDSLEGSDDDSDEDSEEGSEVDQAVTPSTVTASTSMSTTLTVFASSAVEAKLCAATLRAVLEGRSLQAALDVLPSRKDMRAMVVAEREAAAAAAAAGGGGGGGGKNGEGRGRGGGGAAGAGSGRSGARPRGGRREKEKAARRAAAQLAAAGGGGGGKPTTTGSSSRDKR